MATLLAYQIRDRTANSEKNKIISLDNLANVLEKGGCKGNYDLDYVNPRKNKFSVFRLGITSPMKKKTLKHLEEMGYEAEYIGKYNKAN